MMPDTNEVRVSVIIPAHNAAGTISETLESLLVQTYDGWEAIIVDDGSDDETVAIASGFMERDARIRCVSQRQSGVSAARNAGVGLARYDWLLFLDADDWLLPSHLEQMIKVLESGIGADAVFCGAARVTPDGQRINEDFYDEPGDMFHLFARHAVFPIHACVVRKSIVESVGGFDSSLRTCEEWDLWQRIARTGARFGVVREVLALYRMRQESASMDAFQMLRDGLRVINQGHSADPCGSSSDPGHKDRIIEGNVVSTRLSYACWPAGLVLGRGEDARPLLELLGDDRDPQLDPYIVAQAIFKAALISTGLVPARWGDLWTRIEGRIDEFLRALEDQTEVPELATRTRIALKEISREASRPARSLASRATYTIGIDISKPLPDVLAPGSAEQLECLVEAEGTYIGRLDLPICDGFVPGYVIADAIAAEFAWQILGLFFEHAIYDNLTVRREENGLSLWREDACLTETLPVDERSLRDQVHDHAGWTVFLQEVWDRPVWPTSHFYDGQAVEEPVSRRGTSDGWVPVEVSEDIPDLEVSGKELRTVLTVGGVAIGQVTVPVRHTVVSAHELRVALTTASGMELCRAAVREALLGRPLTEPLSLRERLSSVRDARLGQENSGLEITKELLLAPGATPAFDPESFAGERLLVLGRRAGETMETSISRRAMLPAAAFEDLLDLAKLNGDPVIEAHGEGEQPARTIYAPELISPSSRERGSLAPHEAGDRPANDGRDAPVYGRGRFEALFATGADPWKYANPYEQTKYEQTLSLIPEEGIGRAIELACAEGHFTAQLASRVRNLVASDVSQIALDRAAHRLADLENVSFLRLDFMGEPLPGRFDLIVCSEVLYYMDSRGELQAVACKLADALEPGGYLVTAHTYQVTDEPGKPGLDLGHLFGAEVIGETLSATRGLHLLKEIRTPLYRAQLFQRDARRFFRFGRGKPEIIEAEYHSPLPPEVAVYFKRDGDHSIANSAARQVVTTRLPILMYHSVSAESSPDELTRYRVTPEAFEQQLTYLRDAGFRSVSLEEWRIAMESKRPLPGRAVIMTFDDGYRDFLTEAWPLLAKYGFSATVFLVAEKIGQTNEWDQHHGQEIPLLGWEEIHELQREGIEFGSHTLSHPFLTELSIEEVVREAARSRQTLEQGLGTRVRAFAYPYGASDGVIHHLIGACGYTFGLTCRPGPSEFHDPYLALPRIEIKGYDGLQEFVAKVGTVE